MYNVRFSPGPHLAESQKILPSDLQITVTGECDFTILIHLLLTVSPQNMLRIFRSTGCSFCCEFVVDFHCGIHQCQCSRSAVNMCGFLSHHNPETKIWLDYRGLSALVSCWGTLLIKSGCPSNNPKNPKSMKMYCLKGNSTPKWKMPKMGAKWSVNQQCWLLNCKKLRSFLLPTPQVVTLLGWEGHDTLLPFLGQVVS